MARAKRDYEAMDAFRKEHNDEPDGAFFQMAEDIRGWSADDWVWFSEEYTRRLADKGGRG